MKTLSDKINWEYEDINIEDVKDFIKKLKKVVFNQRITNNLTEEETTVFEEIDKLAGPKLT